MRVMLLATPVSSSCPLPWESCVPSSLSSVVPTLHCSEDTYPIQITSVPGSSSTSPFSAKSSSASLFCSAAVFSLCVSPLCLVHRRLLLCCLPCQRNEREQGFASCRFRDGQSCSVLPLGRFGHCALWSGWIGESHVQVLKPFSSARSIRWHRCGCPLTRRWADLDGMRSASAITCASCVPCKQ